MDTLRVDLSPFRIRVDLSAFIEIFIVLNSDPIFSTFGLLYSEPVRGLAAPLFLPKISVDE